MPQTSILRPDPAAGGRSAHATIREPGGPGTPSFDGGDPIAAPADAMDEGTRPPDADGRPEPVLDEDTAAHFFG